MIETGPFGVSGYYPLYDTIEGAILNSPTPILSRPNEDTYGYHIHQFGNKEYDGSKQIEPNKNEFEFTLPNSGRKITFMAMTESRERKVKHQVEAQKKANRKLKDMTSRELTTRMKNMILSVDGSDEQKDINHFVDNELFAVDSKALRAYINESVPDIDLTFEFVSEETGEEREMQLPMDVGFFWPSE